MRFRKAQGGGRRPPPGHQGLLSGAPAATRGTSGLQLGAAHLEPRQQRGACHGRAPVALQAQGRRWLEVRPPSAAAGSMRIPGRCGCLLQRQGALYRQRFTPVVWNWRGLN